MRKHTPLDLHSIKHSACQKCGRELRKENLEQGLCDKISSCSDDGPVRCVGPWAYDKIHFLTRYFNIFGMSMHKLWQGNVHYIEICSGPGRCINREAAEEFDGTALAIMNQPAYPHYKSATFLDLNASVIEALNKRLMSSSHYGKAVAIEADYEKPDDLVNICLKRAPLGLVLIFIDPTDCSVPMNTVLALSRALKNVDFIINVATGSDANRNFGIAFDKPDSPVRSKYRSFLGSDEFFMNPDNCRLAEAGKEQDLRARFRASYRAALCNEGYQHFDVEIVKHYYDILFASKHPRGVELWRKAQSIRPGGQGTLALDI